MKRRYVAIDGNEATAYVAHQINEVIAIYPITPSSNMGEWADEWSAKGQPNIWGTVPTVVEMQSEAGAAAALHGALQTGALATTFTAAQGLLLMIPTMFKISGELTPATIHVSARTVATHALSIFGDHSDVMSTRSCGWGMIASGGVQEAMDMALISQAASLESRIPFLHFFDGFRTSHEVAKIEQLTVEDMRAMIDPKLVEAHRQRAMTPDRPVLRGTSQNPDVYFQAREASNPFYLACPAIVQRVMDKFAGLVGRQYKLFDYVGAPDAERVVVMMGSGAEVAHETVEYLTGKGEKIGLVKVRLYRPFSIQDFVKALPASVQTLVVLDRTKEPGAAGDPLYLDAVTAVNEALAAGEAPFKAAPRILAGRYGLSSKDFTPAMVKAVFDEAAKEKPKNHFTVGINDDVTHASLEFDPEFSTEDERTVRALFYGLGSDGTVGANKNSIKIIGEDTDNYAQGYFVYDSKKAGAVTVSHLRFGPKQIRSSYLISKASFVACHQFSFLERLNMLRAARPGATFLLNSLYGPEEVWDKLPRRVQKQIIDKKLKFYVIDAYEVAKKTGMGVRINTVMQTCFFAISGVLPREEAIAAIKNAIEYTYGKRGEAVVQKNFAAVDTAIDHLHEVKVPAAVTSTFDVRRAVPVEAPEFVQKTLAPIIAGEGDSIPVSLMPVDGTFPTDTARWEKRNIALEIPVWDEDLCIQCGKCILVCPHAVLRAKVYDAELLTGAPPTFKSAPARWKEFKDKKYTLQAAPEDCTGCALCVEVCPVKSKTEAKRKAINMALQPPLRESERANWEFFLNIPDNDRCSLNFTQVKDNQLLKPLFEFSGACAGCGETPYIELITRFFGDRALIGNATGCSSIYGGNLPTTLLGGRQRPRADLEQLAVRGLRGVRHGHPAGRRRAEPVRHGHAAEAFLQSGRRTGGGADQCRPVDRDRPGGAAGTCRRAQEETGEPEGARGARLGGRGRHAREKERLELRRRRLGLRHRLRRAGPRAGLRRQRQPAGNGHRGLLQHGRPDVQGHAHRRRGQVRFRRQAAAQEGSGHDGHVLRQRVCGATGVRLQRHAHREGAAGGRGLRRTFAADLLLPLHRSRVRYDPRPGAAEGGGDVGLLAAVPLQPRPRQAGQEPAGPGFEGAGAAAGEVHLQRNPLHNAGSEQP